MFLSDVFGLAVKALLDRKIRSALTIVGIMVGTAIIVALIASSNGLSAGISTSMGKIGANTLVVNSAMSFVSGSGTQYQLSQNDVSTLAAITGVSEVIPYYDKMATISVGGTTIQGEIEGINLNTLSDLYKGIALSEGAYPSQSDPTAAAIGSDIASPTGSSIQIGVNQMVSVTLSGGGSTSSSNLAFLVKGILNPYGRVLFSNIDDTIFISMQAAQLFLKSPYYSGFFVITSSASDVASVQAAIESQYGSNVRVMNAGSMVSSIESVSSQMTVFLGAIGSVSLFVAAVGITNTMFVSVMERTREIGVLKALGYQSGQILSIFLSESVVTGAIGGVLGTILGYLLSFLMGGIMPMGGGPMSSSGTTTEPIFTTDLLLFSLLFPIAIAVLAGLYPARRASKMNAVIALKYE
ncbi:MAG: FtsX-like permease family protein [Candidatus Bathyarchaeia archaeon]